MADFLKRGLTLRELEVLTLIAAGSSAKEIARQLLITARTVEAHINHIKLKTGTRNRAHLVAVSLEYGLIENPCHVKTGGSTDLFRAPETGTLVAEPSF